MYDASQQLRWKWEQQEAFGNNVPDEDPSALGAFEYPGRLPGQYFDKETNLYYNYFRNYDSASGRYVQSDPIGLLGGLNTFLYVDGAPLSAMDWLGLASGHHFVIGPIRNDPNLSAAASTVFQAAATGPVPGGHNFGEGHAQYNKAVQQLYATWLKENNIDPAKMTKEQAEDFVRKVKGCHDPRIRSFLRSIYDKFLRAGFKKLPIGLRSND